MQFRKSISQTAECLMRSMKSRRVRDFVTDQKLRIEKRGDRNEETTE